MSVAQHAHPPAARPQVRGNPWVPVLITTVMTLASVGLFAASVVGVNHFGNSLVPSGTDQFLTAVLIVAAIIVGSTVLFSVMLLVMAVRQALAIRSASSGADVTAGADRVSRRFALPRPGRRRGA